MNWVAEELSSPTTAEPSIGTGNPVVVVPVKIEWFAFFSGRRLGAQAPVKT